MDLSGNSSNSEMESESSKPGQKSHRTKKPRKRRQHRKKLHYGDKLYQYNASNKSGDVSYYRCAIRACSGRLIVKNDDDAVLSNKHTCEVTPVECSTETDGTTSLQFVTGQTGRKQLLHDGHRFIFEKQLGPKMYWGCAQRRRINCNARVHTVGDSVVHYLGIHNHTSNPAHIEKRRAKDSAIERLRELTLQAEDGDKAIDIVRRLLKEIPPETRAALPEEELLTTRVRRWARSGGVQLVKATFEDYLVEEGLDNVPPPETSSLSQVKREPVASSSETTKKGPELIFLKGQHGEKHRVMIDENLYIWSKDLEKGGGLYRCRESRIGCRVTAKIRVEEKQYEIRGTHAHEGRKAPTFQPKQRFGSTLKLVDEEGRDLGHVPLDNILTAGEDSTNFSFDYESLPRANVPPPSDSTPGISQVGHQDQAQEAIFGDNDFFDDGHDGGDDRDDFSPPPVSTNECENTEIRIQAEPTTTGRERLTAATVTTSSKTKSRRTMKDAVKSGEVCFVCGDELVVSETLSCSEETFRKACCYLNVKSSNEWFPRKSSGQFYSFCESCTDEVTRIHQLYKKMEEIQSQIFRKVEGVEKRTADAEIIDNWMAEAPITSVKRFEGFRKQVLINYKNKLRLRREIREGRKMGFMLTEIQPITSAHMFASDPAETDAYSRRMPSNDTGNTLSGLHSTSPAKPRTRGRPKSKKVAETICSTPYDPLEQIVHNSTLGENTFGACDDADDGGDIDHFDDAVDSMSVTSEKEVKFWESDPGRLQVGKGRKSIDEEVEESDPDYNVESDDDWEDTKKKSTRKKQKGSKLRSSKSVPTTKPIVGESKTWAQRFAEARAEKAARRAQLAKDNPSINQSQTPQLPVPEKKQKKTSRRQHSHNFEFPDAVLTKDGRVFMSGVEIIKNAPGALRRRPRSVSFTCGACGKIILTFWKIRQHICGFHLDMYKCFCGKKFSEPKSLINHKERSHSEKGRERTPCPICERPIAGNERAVRVHMWSHLSEEEKNDPKYESYRPRLKDPNRLKHAQTFMCSFCSKTFYRPDSLKKHELTHTGDAPTFMCQYCGKVYSSKKSISQHSKLCTANPENVKKEDGIQTTYPCPKCTVRFKSRATRSKHVAKYHTVKDAVMPFACPKCPRRFRSRSGFKTHKRVCVEGQTAPNLKHGKYRVIPLRHDSESQQESSLSIPKYDDEMEIPSTSSSSYGRNVMENTSAAGLISYNMFGNHPDRNLYQPHYDQ